LKETGYIAPESSLSLISSVKLSEELFGKDRYKAPVDDEGGFSSPNVGKTESLGDKMKKSKSRSRSISRFQGQNSVYSRSVYSRVSQKPFNMGSDQPQPENKIEANGDQPEGQEGVMNVDDGFDLTVKGD
jgi:hypothetical protein